LRLDHWYSLNNKNDKNIEKNSIFKIIKMEWTTYIMDFTIFTENTIDSNDLRNEAW
jgi:hypothetical protein